MKDIPYSALKQDKRAYEILLLRDQHSNTFAGIAREYEISVGRVVQVYNRQKRAQIHLYIHHIAVVLGHPNTAQIHKVYDDAKECYRDRIYACAYLEKKYKDILIQYRNGEPGTPEQFIRSMPPLKSKLSKKAIARIVEMREVDKASYTMIAKEFHITRAKAMRTYETFYHEKVLALVEALQKKAESEKDSAAIWRNCFSGNKSAKERYDMLTKG